MEVMVDGDDWEQLGGGEEFHNDVRALLQAYSRPLKENNKEFRDCKDTQG
jgi:hypothetical protein